MWNYSFIILASGCKFAHMICTLCGDLSKHRRCSSILRDTYGKTTHQIHRHQSMRFVVPYSCKRRSMLTWISAQQTFDLINIKQQPEFLLHVKFPVMSFVKIIPLETATATMALCALINFFTSFQVGTANVRIYRVAYLWKCLKTIQIRTRKLS